MTHDVVVSAFRRHYGRAPAVVARAPGRVNLIGEHTDYNALPVLPMAVDRCVFVAGAPREDRRVALANVDSSFSPRGYELAESIPPYPRGDWANYHKAAAQGLLSALGPGALYGGDFLVAGDVPPGAGLSSSSALLVGSALALLAVNERVMPPAELAALSAAAERYVGTLSGGMDQAVCLLAREGHALRIDFEPLRSRAVPIGTGCAFVVCHSLVTAEKSGAARTAYNRRVHECRLACRVLERALGSSLPHPLRTFGDLVGLFPDRTLVDFLPLLEQTLPPRALTLDEIARIVGADAQEIAGAAGIEVGETGRYALLARARHVLSEAARVDAAERALAAGDWPRFGGLMDASHASCRDDYEVSCEELEEVVRAAKEAGALGARLTGAGFGGCTVNLVAAERAPDFLAAIERRYYAGRATAREREHCFVFAPAAGASIARL